ncbi:FUSC family protein [Halosquirtibacter laminarini]|uniref:FUSC family protein n=1 Tax=Halosquirtibacter laminarini TaxID=3374600 RepID=A0AC61NHJ8_9BACT|nr:FUSC family protein [Prolixibacteraceae bacterium]
MLLVFKDDTKNIYESMSSKKWGDLYPNIQNINSIPVIFGLTQKIILLVVSLYVGNALALDKVTKISIFYTILFYIFASDPIAPLRFRLKYFSYLFLSFLSLSITRTYIPNTAFFNSTLIFIIIIISIGISKSFTFKNRFHYAVIIGFTFLSRFEIIDHTPSLIFGTSIGYVLYIFTTTLFFIFSWGSNHLKKIPSTDVGYQCSNPKYKECLSIKDICSNTKHLWNRLSIFRFWIALTISFIVMEFYDIYYACWIPITVVVLFNPAPEIHKYLPKTIHRFVGTIIGVILFNFAHHLPYSHMMVDLLMAVSFIMIILYLSSDYFIAIIFMTIIVIGSITLRQPNQVEMIEYERILYTFYAIGITYTVNLCVYIILRIRNKVWQSNHRKEN